MSVYEQESESGRMMSPDDCQAALAAAQRKNEELRDKYLRAAARIENTRKQAERDTRQQINQRLRSFCARLLVVTDNLERALAHTSEDNPLRSGIQATLQLLWAALQQEGVSPIPVAVGAPFDPHFHEAIAAHEANVKQETVVEIVQTGYTFGDELLRPARVVVARQTCTDTLR
jgi:molecular chaperone GrpE